MEQFLLEIDKQMFSVNVQSIAPGQYMVEIGGRVFPCTVEETPVSLEAAVNRAVAEIEFPAPQIVVNVPPQPAPIVHVAPPQVSVNIPALKLQAGSVAKVRRDYTGKITEVTSNAQVTGTD